MLVPDLPPRTAYRNLRIIYIALNSGLLIFFMVGVYLNGMQIPPFKDEIDVLTVVNIFLLAAIPLGYVISNRKMETINPKQPFSRKWEQFQSAMIIRWAMIEGTALLSIVGLILLHDAKQLILFVICILIFSSNTLTKEKVIRLAKLNTEEAKALEE
jgi:hypothetical protein